LREAQRRTLRIFASSFLILCQAQRRTLRIF
jgi:hypothetical protein